MRTALGLRLSVMLLFGMALAASAQIPGLPPLGEKRAETPAPAKAAGTEQSAPAKTAPAGTPSRVDQLIADFRADRDRPLPPPPEGITATEATNERELLVTLSHLNDRRAYADGELARFGTQTIIKSFISGMILLVERRVQIGDVIDIDGVSGTVTTVDLRSSTVRSGDGKETLVPNSVLLEHKVTNWTLSDRKVRASVRVGVAYGTPMRAAAEKIENCAKRHGHVLKDPAPQVLFEDFGDSAKLLTLYFWVEVSEKVGATQVASDLRFILDKTLADDGIVIAFPQRDVRVDSTRPLRVEVIPASPAQEPRGAAGAEAP